MAGGLDNDTIQRILQRQGASDTPDNVNRIVQMAAANPDILERYSMSTAAPQRDNGRNIRGGAGAGGAGDNAALLQLEPQQVAMERRPSIPVQEAAQAAPVQRTAPPAAAAPAPPNRTQFGPPEPFGPQAPPPTKEEVGGFDWTDLLKYLPAVLGLRAANAPGGPWKGPQGPDATYVGPMDRSTVSGPQDRLTGPRQAITDQSQRGPQQPGALPQPDPKLENQRNVQTRNSPDLERAGANRAAREGEMRHEIDQENAARAAQESEQLRQQMRQAEEARRIQAAQQGTRETINAANSATGRKTIPSVVRRVVK